MKSYILLGIIGLIIISGCSMEDIIPQTNGGLPASDLSGLTEEQLKDEYVRLSELNTEYSVVYESAMQLTENTDKVPGETTIYVKGSEIRMDTSMDFGGILGSSSSRIWILEDKTVSCASIAGEEECYEYPGLAEEEGDLRSLLFVQKEDIVSIESVGIKTIAGETGNCFKLTVKTDTIYGNLESEECITSDGIVLQSKTEIAEMAAKSVSRSVQAADLTPPVARTIDATIVGRCIGLNKLLYLDHTLSNEGFIIVLQNGTGGTITDISADFTESSGNVEFVQDAEGMWNPSTMQSTDMNNFSGTIVSGSFLGSEYVVSVAITYKSPSGLSITETATCTGNVS